MENCIATIPTEKLMAIVAELESMRRTARDFDDVRMRAEDAETRVGVLKEQVEALQQTVAELEDRSAYWFKKYQDAKAAEKEVSVNG